MLSTFVSSTIIYGEGYVSCRLPLLIHPNIYNKLWYIFIVQYLKKFNVGGDDNELYKITVAFKFTRSNLDPGGNIEWKAKYRNCKLELPGTPNQYFFPKKPNNNKKKVG